MIHRVLLIIYFQTYLIGSVYGQKVDETRLEYFEDRLDARQMGMCVSHDQKMAAFLFDNQQLRVFNLANSNFITSMEVEFNEIGR